MTQYKYYFKSPKGAIVKDILTWLVTGGVVYIAASSPYFVHNLLHEFRRGNKYRRRSVVSAFRRLRKEGCLVIRKRNHQIYISLTERGRKRAGRFQINHLKIKKPKRWDGKWRLIVFDIAHKQRIKREALRGFLKRLDLHPLQKSVWVYPYDCRDEINLLKSFFGFSSEELRLVVAEDIGDDRGLKKLFDL